MNIKSLFMGMAAVATLAACSNNELEDVQTGMDEGQAPVEIKLASTATIGVAAGTRASIESSETGAFEAKGIGVFCLAKAKQGVNAPEKDIEWVPGTPFCIPMENVEANAELDADDNTKTNLVWADPAALYFYPTGNWYSYDFYGYHPYVETADVVADGVQRKVSYTLNGSQDVIWGKATSDEQYAYSAKYFRVPGNQEKVPNMAFQHKLMRITFSYIAGEDYVGSGTYANAKNMGVHSITILNAPTECELVIADKNNAANEGMLTVNMDESTFTQFSLLDANDAPLAEDYWVKFDGETPVETKIGQGVLLCVPDYTKMADFKYMIQVILKDQNGNLFTTEYPLVLQNNTPFTAGNSYNVLMTVNGAKLIQLTSTLEAWKEDKVNIDGVEL